MRGYFGAAQDIVGPFSGGSLYGFGAAVEGKGQVAETAEAKRFRKTSRLDAKVSSGRFDKVEQEILVRQEGKVMPFFGAVDGAAAFGQALILAAVETEDGRPLFPQVRAALPLIKRLDDPELARRFVEMVGVRDIAIWLDPD